MVLELLINTINPEITQWRSVELKLAPKGDHISLDRIKYTEISPQEGRILHMAYLGPKVV